MAAWSFGPLPAAAHGAQSLPTIRSPVSMYPADLLTGSSLSLGYQLGAAAAAASPWRQLYMPASPAGDHRYHHSHSPLTSTIAMSPHQLHHQQQSVWSPISAFTHPAAAAGFTEGGAMSYYNAGSPAYLSYLSLLTNAAAAAAAAAGGSAYQPASQLVPGSPFPSPSSAGCCTPGTHLDVSPSFDFSSPFHPPSTHRLLDLHKGYRGSLYGGVQQQMIASSPEFSPVLPPASSSSSSSSSWSGDCAADRVKSEEARVDSDLKCQRPASHDDVTRRGSTSDDVQLRHSGRRGRRHGDDRDISVSRTRRERAQLGFRDKLDELRLQDTDMRVPSHPVTSSDDVTMTSPGLLTSHRKEVELTTADDGDDGDNVKPVCAVTSWRDDSCAEMTSKSSLSVTSPALSSVTSRWCSASAACPDLSIPVGTDLDRCHVTPPRSRSSPRSLSSVEIVAARRQRRTSNYSAPAMSLPRPVNNWVTRSLGHADGDAINSPGCHGDVTPAAADAAVVSRECKRRCRRDSKDHTSSSSSSSSSSAGRVADAVNGSLRQRDDDDDAGGDGGVTLRNGSRCTLRHQLSPHQLAGKKDQDSEIELSQLRMITPHYWLPGSGVPESPPLWYPYLPAYSPQAAAAAAAALAGGYKLVPDSATGNCYLIPAVWPPPPTGSSDTCHRRCRDTSQQTNLSELQQTHSTDDDHHLAAPRVKSEHLSPPATSSSPVTSLSRDRDRVVTSSYSVTSRGTSPLDVTLYCPAVDGSRGTVTSPELVKCSRPSSLTLSTGSRGVDRSDNDGGTTGRTSCDPVTESRSVDRCDNDGANTGRTSCDAAATCLSSLGYEIECITPVDDEPVSGTFFEERVLNCDDGGLSGLDVLSCVASSQIHEACSTRPARRQFSILDLPLSQFMDAAVADGDDGKNLSSSSPDVISADYNVPSAGDCVVSSETMSRVIQQQNSGSETSTEQRAGDVFAALKVDVGPENMDAMELDVRMRLAELQVKYREKQRELARLQRRSSSEKSQVSRSGRRRVSVRSRSTGHTRRSLSNASVTSEPSCDVIAASRNIKTSSDHGRRSLSSVSVTSEPSCDVIAASRNIKMSSTELRVELMSDVTSQQSRQLMTSAPVTSSSTSSSGHVTLSYSSPSAKTKDQTKTSTKPLRTKLQVKTDSKKAAQKPSAQHSVKNSLKTSDCESVKKKLKSDAMSSLSVDTSKLEEGPGFYTDEWYRRRSERIFLHEAVTSSLSPTDKLTSPSAKSPASRITSATISSPTSSTAKSAGSSAPRNGGAIVLSSSSLSSTSSSSSSSARTSIDVLTATAGDISSSKSPRQPSNTTTSSHDVTMTSSCGPGHRSLLTSRSSSSSSASSSSAFDSSSDDDDDDDDVPLSSLINQSRRDSLSKSCALKPEDLRDGLRILFLKEGLFYEGFVKEVMPPDVYGVVVDGERGNRPNIMAQQDLLTHTVLIVRPSSRCQLTVGTRVCAYWSEKFTCLHPGTVCQPSSDDDDDDDDGNDETLFSVDFDDGDAGKIPLDYVRMLPADFPLQPVNNSSLMLAGRKKRSVSGDVATTLSTVQPPTLSPAAESISSKLTPSKPAGGDVTSKKAKSGEASCGRASLSDIKSSASEETSGTVAKVTERRKSELTLTIKCSQAKNSAKDVSSDDDDDDNDDDDDSSSSTSSSNSEDETEFTTKRSFSSNVDHKSRTNFPTTAKTTKKKEQSTDSDSNQGSSDAEAGSRVPPSSSAAGGSQTPSKVTKRKKSMNSETASCKRRRRSFLSVWQQWRWLGNCTQRPGLKGRARKLYYKAIQRGNETLRIGDSAVFISAARNVTYIGHIISLWETWDGSMFVRVKWFYHPQETKGGNRLLEVKGALYQSSHEDENDVQTISHKCDVLSYTDYVRRRHQQGSDQQHNSVYYLAGTYEPVAERISFERDVKLAY